MDDVILNKAAAIERCLRRVHEVHAGDDRNLCDDLAAFARWALANGGTKPPVKK